MSNITLKTKDIIENPIKFANDTQLIVLISLIKKANHYYYNTDKPLFNDDVYDNLLGVLDKRDPKNDLLNNLGASVIGEKFDLPIHMGSMNKHKTIDGVKSWLISNSSQEYLISEKLDGTSCGCQYLNGKITLFTRGRVGNHGRNISHLVKYLNMPKISTNLIIRGELLISKKNINNFDNKKDPRSVVNGISIRKFINKKDMKSVDFVAYEVVEPNNLTAYDQFKLLNKLGFKTAKNKLISLKDLSTLTNKIEHSYIYKTLIDFKVNSEYQIDGIIVTTNHLYNRNDSGNPKYSFAFKANDQGKEVKVIKVDWNISKYAVLKPRVNIEEVELNGVKVNHATAHHARYVVENKIGPGSILKVVRSGDVIPYIMDVLVQSDKPQMPNIEYKWNETKVNILLSNTENNVEHTKKKIISFLKTLNIENISVGTINKLLDNKFDSIPKILRITTEELVELPGFKDKMSQKLYTNIHKIIDNPIELSTIMVASLVFGSGFGFKRLNAIIQEYPNILDLDVSEYMITKIPGFQSKTALQFIKNLKDFKIFLNSIPMIKIKTEIKNVISDELKDQYIVLTGFNDKLIEKYIIDNGGIIQNIINSKTNLLISKNNISVSSKYQKATELNIKIITKDNFVKQIFKY